MSENGEQKIALLVVDGLSVDQWLVARDALLSQQPTWQFDEHAVFAWIPSITTVSRQTLFAGRAPLYFPGSIGTTDKEGVLWAQYWTDQGFSANEIVYMKGLGEGSLAALNEAVSHPKARIAGLVVDKVDKIMHGMELGTTGMHNQVRQWVGQGYLRELLTLLMDNDFSVYLTSDHGNIEAKGCGRPAEGAIAELRGERCRMYSDKGLRRKVSQSFPGAIEWEPLGLPEDYLALLAPARRAFVEEKKRIVAHGGAALEEVIVPLIHISRRAE